MLCIIAEIDSIGSYWQEYLESRLRGGIIIKKREYFVLNAVEMC